MEPDRLSIKLNSPSIEPWMTRETESNSALRWTYLDNAERKERGAEKEAEEKKDWGGEIVEKKTMKG